MKRGGCTAIAALSLLLGLGLGGGLVFSARSRARVVHEGPIRSLGVTRNGEILAASDDSTIALYSAEGDPERPTVLRQWHDPSECMRSAVITDRGDFVVVGRLVRRGSMLPTLTVLDAGLNVLTNSRPFGSAEHVVAGLFTGGDQVIGLGETMPGYSWPAPSTRVWRAGHWAEGRPLVVAEEPVTCAAVSRSGQFAVLGSRHSLSVVELPAGRVIATFPMKFAPEFLSVDDDCHDIAVGGRDIIELLDARTGTSLERPEPRISCLALLGQSKTVIYGRHDGAVALIDFSVSPPQPVQIGPLDARDAPTCVAWLPPRRVVIGTVSGAVRLFQVP